MSVYCLTQVLMQTMWTQIRLLLQGQSDMDLLCLSKRLQKHFNRRKKPDDFCCIWCSKG